MLRAVKALLVLSPLLAIAAAVVHAPVDPGRSAGVASLAAGAAALAAPAVAEPGVQPDPRPALGELRFVPNLGQWDPAVRFATLGDTAAWVTDDGFTLRFARRIAGAHDAPGAATAEITGGVVRTRFVAAAQPEFAIGAELDGRHNFFVGDDPAGWRTDVPAYAGVRMAGVYPGIDVQLRSLGAGRRGALEYDLLLAPGADLTRFQARCEGAERLAIDAAGRLCTTVPTPDGAVTLVQEAPVAWQDGPEGRRPLAVHFVLHGDDGYGFAADDLDPACAATIDPGIVWATYLGGGAQDSVNGLAWQPGVGIWVGGWAGSTNFPTTVGAFRTVGGQDAFLARLNDSGTVLVFSTYFGGSDREEIRGIALGPGLTVAAVGYTHSNDLPVTAGALQASYAGANPFVDIGDGFVVRLTAAGNALVASTYLGGVFDDIAEAVAVDALGNTFVAGWTSSYDFPVTAGAWRTTFGGVPGAHTDGFVAKLAANLQSKVWSTYVGGSYSDQLLSIALDPANGEIVTAGWTLSSDYPTTLNAYRTTLSGDIDAIVTRLQANGTGAAWSSFLGGIAAESAQTVFLASNGTVWVGGGTDSVNFPTTLNAPQRVLGGDKDGFVSQFSANGQSLVFSTLLGGAGPDKVRGVAASGTDIVAVGEAGVGFPVTPGAAQPVFGTGSLDGFVSFFTGGGPTLAYSTYLGGDLQEAFGSVALDATGLAVVGGWCFSSNFPIAPATLSSTLLGVEDGIVLKFDFASTLVRGFAVTPSTPAAVAFVTPGTTDLLECTCENRSGRELTIERVRLLVAGRGATPALVGPLHVRFAVTTPPGTAEAEVAGPVALVDDDQEIEVSLAGAVLPIGAFATLRVVADVSADPSGATAEVACAIVDADAWTLLGDGAAGGPEVRVDGSGRVEGSSLVLGVVPGDLDGDGAVSVVDVRRACAQSGSAADAADCDGDGVWTAADVAAMRAALLGRPQVFTVPAAVQRDAWMTVRGVFPHGATVDASIGGRALTVGCLTPRELTLHVAADQPVGTQELVVSIAGRLVVTQFVQVQ